jgi:hypothetical protein
VSQLEMSSIQNPKKEISFATPWKLSGIVQHMVLVIEYRDYLDCTV